MEIHNYWEDIDLRLENLIKNGYVKLPSLESFEINKLAIDINAEMNGSTFLELCPSHDFFLKKLRIHEILTPKLYSIARNEFGYKGDMSNQYHIARLVEAGNVKEMYRAHFDSHLFTLVLPIKIPQLDNSTSIGDLIYFPKARSTPRSELENFFGKLTHKRFATRNGIEHFSKNHNKLTDNFLDYKPLLFIGNTTLHTNKQVSADCKTYRLTLLAHFFDPSPKYGVGGALRIIRNR